MVVAASMFATTPSPRWAAGTRSRPCSYRRTTPAPTRSWSTTAPGTARSACAGTYATGGKGGVAAGAAATRLPRRARSPPPSTGSCFWRSTPAVTQSRSFAWCAVTSSGLQQVIASGGQFPASIAVHGDLVYVLNAGVEGGSSSRAGLLASRRPSLADPRLEPLTRPERTPIHPIYLASPGRSASAPTVGA